MIDTFSLSGSFAFVRTSSPRAPGDIARLMSPEYEDQDGRCVRFWYHMYGKDVGKLSVFAYDTKTGLDSAPIWAQKGWWKNIHTPFYYENRHFSYTSGMRIFRLLPDFRLFCKQNSIPFLSISAHFGMFLTILTHFQAL